MIEMINDPKKNGSTLMAIGGIAMAMTVAGLFVAFRSVQTSGSAAALAEGISAALMPLVIGGPAFLIGLVLFAVGLSRCRSADFGKNS